MKEKVNKRIDQFILETDMLFKEFLAGWTMYSIGRDNLDSVVENTAISPFVGYNQRLEPIPIVLIKKFRTGYSQFILEAYHGKLVILGNRLLNALFCILLEEHLQGTRKFVELKTQLVKIDLSSMDDLSAQFKENCKNNFSFNKYSERLKIVNKALNPNDDGQNELGNIKKNILVRNSIQHSEGMVDDYMLRELGCDKIELADESGKIRIYRTGDKLILSIPELYSFMSSFLFIAQKWRVKK